MGENGSKLACFVQILFMIMACGITVPTNKNNEKYQTS